MDLNMSDFLWVEKYRPKIIEDCILPDAVKEIFKGFVSQEEIPNLLLSGTAGVGKTTIAKALCEEIGASYIIINGSDEGRFLDTIRNKVRQFATTVSLTSGARHKVVIIDEADNTTNDVQLSLRNAVEEFHSNCRFIFTCNFINKIIEPLHSRCSVVQFKVPEDDKKDIQLQFLKRIKTILVHENIEHDDRVIAKLLQRYYPDWRRLINEIQALSTNGSIGADALALIPDIRVESLYASMKSKDYTSVRKWVVDNLNNDPTNVISKIYNTSDEYVVKKYIPELVLVCAKYQTYVPQVADQEINLLAFLTEIMMSCEFK
jgi:replication factor C small subunit